MNLKNSITPYLAILGVVGSVFGINSLLAESDIQVPLSVSASGESVKDTSNTVCSKPQDTFAQDETQVLASEYSKDIAAECVFVGCGGII